jgi:hypothetical protein
VNGETAPVQIRIWFPDGGYYDLRGTLDKLETDRQFMEAGVDWGQHKIYQTAEVRWTLEGTMAAWEFDKDGKPDVLKRAPVARQLAAGRKPYLGGPDRSKRARRRARSRARSRHAA